MPTIPKTDERKRPLFSVPEVARAAGQDRSTVYRWCRAGLVKFKQPAPGRTIFIPRSEVERVWGWDVQEVLDGLRNRATEPPFHNVYPRPGVRGK